jgi:hypothetical protein
MRFCFLSLRERIEVRVYASNSPLTLSLSPTGERGSHCEDL